MKSHTLRVGRPQYAPKWLDKKGTFEVIEKTPAILANGGSCIAGPDGEWVLEPQIGIEGVMVAVFPLGGSTGSVRILIPQATTAARMSPDWSSIAPGRRF
jgi:hypothetical protein